jgi:hypothetical protein
MKYLLAITILALTILGCESNKTTVTNTSSENNKGDTIRIANDSLEYEILIIEPGFTGFMITQQPRGYYGLTYLENKNRLWVTEYNQRAQNIQRYDINLYPQTINYEPQTDYGYEVNYLLYNYFVFFQQKYKQDFPGAR